MGWVRSPKGRRFEPYIELLAGPYRLVINGYEQVWDFIDAIQPDLYRTSVNACMKGDMGINFKEVLANFLDESEQETIIFSYEKLPIVAVPNSDKFIENAYVIRNTESFQDSTLPLRLLPSGYEDEYLDAEIYDNHPNYTVIQEWDNKFAVSSFVVAEHEQKMDIRPFPLERFSNLEDARKRAYERIGHMNEQDYTLSVNHLTKHKGGMLTIERDYFEYSNFLKTL